MDLQTEYTQRHQIDTIVGCPDSFVFFTSNEITYVATISHRPRIFSACQKCHENKVAIEIWVINTTGMGLIFHDHLDPNADLISNMPFKNIKIIRHENEKEMNQIIWKALGGKGQDTEIEMFESIRTECNKVSLLANIVSTVTYRRSPLVCDETKDT